MKVVEEYESRIDESMVVLMRCDRDVIRVDEDGTVVISIRVRPSYKVGEPYYKPWDGGERRRWRS